MRERETKSAAWSPDCQARGARRSRIRSRWANFDKTWVSEAEYVDYQKLTRLFRDVASWGDNGEVALTSPGAAPVAAGSVLLPAARASRVQPVEALRSE